MSAKDSLASKQVFVCGLLHKKTCFCEKCRSSGACTESLPDSLRDTILHKFHEQIRNDRLEKLGTYAMDFGDNKIVRKGDDTVYLRSVIVHGEDFSVAYKLVSHAIPPDRRASEGCRPNGDAQDSQVRLTRQMSQG